ncbi:exonuclease domain-containing protein [Yoonia sp.]|uniref:exonuclease domain-containing protein n=1 Tax=Yoonia sp. TaxID=2212373 RepID=UPI003A4D34A1
MNILKIFGLGKARDTEKKKHIQPTITSPQEKFRFIAIDVETANSDPSSICQIGLAFVDPDNGIEVVCTFVDPKQPFDSFNTSLHGIGPNHVRGKPTFKEAYSHIAPILARQPVVQHSDFDRRAISAACAHWRISGGAVSWVDSVAVARKAWPEFIGNGGHGLAHLKEALQLEFVHHNAGEDAKAAAQVVILAEQRTKIDFLQLAQKGSSKRNYAKQTSRDGVPTGELAGHVAVFTGSLTISREEAASFAANVGINVRTTVTAKTTLLIVGDQDLSVLAGHQKSSKHRKAEQCIAEGQSIRIMAEAEFLALVDPEQI